MLRRWVGLLAKSDHLELNSDHSISLFTHLYCRLFDFEDSEAHGSAKEAQKIVLFVAINDLRMELGTYGHTQVVTPKSRLFGLQVSRV